MKTLGDLLCSRRSSRAATRRGGIKGTVSGFGWTCDWVRRDWEREKESERERKEKVALIGCPLSRQPNSSIGTRNFIEMVKRAVLYVYTDRGAARTSQITALLPTFLKNTWGTAHLLQMARVKNAESGEGVDRRATVLPSHRLLKACLTSTGRRLAGNISFSAVAPLSGWSSSGAP